MINQSSLKPLNSYDWSDIRLVATDMDGTLTNSEKFNSQLLATLTELAAKGIDVLITTGRSAGWVQAIATYLPVVGTMAENGGLIYWKQNLKPQFMTAIEIDEHRLQLGKVFNLLRDKFPQIKESADNLFRLTDWTFDVRGLTETELAEIDLICQSQGYGFTYSTVQCHIKPLHQDKAYGLNKVISQYFPDLQPEQILTIGDSPNDESMFNPAQFPLSVGVVNILKYRHCLQYLPAYVTSQPEGLGFCELAQFLLHNQSR